MAQLSVSEAAKLVGRNRKSLYRDIKRGRLSATVDATGERQIETSELLRAYGSFVQIVETGDKSQTVSMSQHETPNETNGDRSLLARLTAENEQLHQRLLDKERHIEDMRNTMRLLEYHRKPWWKIW